MRDTMIVGMLALVFGVSVVKGEIPGKAGDYLKKLKEFELERVAAAEAEITQKREQVAAVLKRELAMATAHASVIFSAL